MKSGIHPEYKPSRITCACGRVTETYATVEELHVEICSHCHPFYTGRQKLVDTAGRVERFRRKYASEDEGASEDAASEEAADAADADEAAETGTGGDTGAGEPAADATPEPIGAGSGEPASDDTDD